MMHCDDTDYTSHCLRCGQIVPLVSDNGLLLLTGHRNGGHLCGNSYTQPEIPVWLYSIPIPNYYITQKPGGGVEVKLEGTPNEV